MKTAEVTVSFQGYDWQNVFTMRSPTGREVSLRCNGKWNEMSEELRALINKYQFATSNDTPWGTSRQETVTHDILAEVLRLSRVR